MKNHQIAYFSAEIGISSNLPTYSGGLGVLAGDHIKSAADLKINMVAISLLYKEGYFKQIIDQEGKQREVYPKFVPEPILSELSHIFSINLNGKEIFIKACVYNHQSINGFTVPIYFLDTDISENDDETRGITLRLYSGDNRHRILQESILGYGGMKLLEILNQTNIKKYHMNEGHCSFIVLDLLKKYKGDIEKVRSKCHFTTHTPVPAGHDQFEYKLVKEILGNLISDDISLPSMNHNKFHMTELGLQFSKTANGVSKLHGDVAQKQFPWRDIGYVTNGVHHYTWVSNSFAALFDEFFPNWQYEPESLKNIDKVDSNALWDAHFKAKTELLHFANSQLSKALDPNILTIGFARRAATYKRAQLIFKEPEKLIDLGAGKIQLVFSGKAHPNDKEGKELISGIIQNAKDFEGKIKIIYLENYNMWLGKLITSGVDVWLNTPLRPNEASGTSGMKSALNGIPNLSILDGWWDEGCNDKVNGWSIGSSENVDDDRDVSSLYETLKLDVIPTFYDDRERWISIMRNSIKTGVDFTSQRMLKDYQKLYYR
tara:strand:- start:2645 stop:4279 length:1635 start_codon:yes stop_codon:yes gene_type:complete